MNKKELLNKIYDKNITTASRGLNGFDVKILKPTKENLKKFQEQFAIHQMCGCYSCIQAGKLFVEARHDLKEEVIGASTQEFEHGSTETI